MRPANRKKQWTKAVAKLSERESMWLYITPEAWGHYRNSLTETPFKTPVVSYHLKDHCWGVSYNNWGPWIWGFATRQEAQEFAEHPNFYTIMRLREKQRNERGDIE